MSDAPSSTPSPPRRDPTNEVLAANIRAAFDRFDVSQREIAGRMEVHESTVARLAAGDMALTAAYLGKFASAFGLQLDQLITGDFERSCTAGH